jgi:endonuclease/exonuclease/phosphatase family metal-dependent hydrolase
MLHWEREPTRDRLKLYAECEWIHRRVDEWLDGNKHVVVMGDFNDEPGMDFYEFKYGHSAIEIIVVNIFEPDKTLRNYAEKPKWTTNW